MAIKPLGRQQAQHFVKLSPIPFFMALGFALFTLMVLWRMHPDIFGNLGERLYTLVSYAPVVIAGLAVAGMILFWVVVLITEHDTGIAPPNIRHHYSTALMFVFATVAIVFGVLFWVYFNGIAYYQEGFGERQPENMDASFAFGRFPIIITGEILLGFWVFKHFHAMFKDGLVRHAWHLLIGLCALALVLCAQFLYLGITQNAMPIQGLLGDVMMVAMVLYALFTGLVAMGAVFCIVRMALGHYQGEDNFSIALLYQFWWGLCVLWGLSMIVIIVWRPALA